MKAGIDFIGITTPFFCHDGQGNFILHKRSNQCRDERGFWDVGSGKLEFGQTLEESVLREVKEEYGCIGIIQNQLPPYTLLRTHEGVKTHWIAIPFLILVDPKKMKNNDPDKITEVGLFSLLKLPKPLHSGLRYILKRNASYFKKYHKGG